MTERHFPTEDEQRARVRAAALAQEADLLARVGDPGVAALLKDVQDTLDRVGRTPSYTEEIALRRLRQGGRHDPGV